MYYFILYIILALYGVVFAVLYINYEIVVFVGVLLLLPFLSYLLTMISGMFVKVSCSGDDGKVKQGEEAKIQVHIENKSIIPVTNGVLWYTCGYQMGGKPKKQKVKFKVKGRGESTQNVILKGDYCGVIQFSIKRITIRDFFHIFPFIKKQEAVYQQVIFPEMKEISMDVEHAVSFYNDEYEEFYEDHPGNDPSEVYEIRSYREGDKLQRIHWKLSSKRDEYMVKEYSDPIIINSVIICDNMLSCDKSERVEKWSNLIEKTIQASYSLLIQQVIHYVYWFDSECMTGIKKEIRNEQDMICFASQLLQSQVNQDPEDYVNYLLHSENVGENANIFYVGECNQQQLTQGGLTLKAVD